jgi:hypothetical protein
MLNPQDNNLNNSQNRISNPFLNDIGNEREIEAARTSGWRWYWVWPVIIVLVLAVWWAGWGWGRTGAWWWGHNNSGTLTVPAPADSRTTETLANAGAQQDLPAGSTGSQSQKMTGAGVEVLTSQNKQPYIGKEIALNSVPVQQKVSSRAVWIGTGNPMLAVVKGTGSSSQEGVEQGQIVNAKGVVEKAPPKNQAKHEWALSDSDASRLEQEGAYIEVSQLSIPPQ